jgi:predicted nucleotidyltransferase
MTPDLKITLDRAVSHLKAAGAREVYVFGSAIRPSGRPPQDLHLAVSGLPRGQFFHLQGLLLCLDHSVDLVDLDQNTPFTRHLREANELVRVG